MFLKELTISNTKYIHSKTILFENQITTLDGFSDTNVCNETCAILQGVTTRGIDDLNIFVKLPPNSKILCKYQIDEPWGSGELTLIFEGGKRSSVQQSSTLDFGTFQNDYPLRDFSVAEKGCNLFDCNNHGNFSKKLEEYVQFGDKLSCKYQKYNLGEAPINFAKRQNVPYQSEIVDIVYWMLLSDFIPGYCKKLQANPRQIAKDLFLSTVDDEFVFVNSKGTVQSTKTPKDDLLLQFASFVKINNFWQAFHYHLTVNPDQPIATYNIHNRFWKAYTPEPLTIQHFELLQYFDQEKFMAFLTSSNRQIILI